ncbi:DUF1819 family protein [Clostridium tarantellae]|uniref:DUF1819 family protein n=1 Tax=Clostridium tarantellae TaxID=39493 RepID=A0A6I1MNP3_9CLOT|nr:DUF1819 family protein [Clostridium tarantellae]MPQ42521.1 DUF1819 family protein [Clostridium tarantellae]
MEYSAGMTSRPYLYKETKMVATLMSQGKSVEEIKNLAIEENIFQFEKEYRREEIVSAIIGRLKDIDEFIIEKIANGGLSMSKLLVVYVIMKSNRLFFEFVNEVYREKVLLRDLYIRDKDINMFFQIKTEESEKIAKWSESTMKKLRTVYVKILFESGLISSIREDREISVPFIDEDIKHCLTTIGDKAYVIALQGLNN